ncbi:hypothetical protein V7S43_015821 [Phytophthora oleae]|uniref:Uncharacterized protein n=1 Tax=Phytophthora oleae TaxID=2107226 RepID=A0ABD3EXR7_9STRA
MTSAGMEHMPRCSNPVLRLRSRELLTRLPPRLFPVRDSLRAVNPEPLNRLSRTLRSRVPAPFHTELAFPLVAPLLENPFHVVVAFSVPVEQGWRGPRPTTPSSRPRHRKL